MEKQQTAIVLLALCVLPLDGFRKQTVSVRGQLVCQSNRRNAAGVKVKLVDYDWGPDPDDTMGETRTSQDGSFAVSGHARELGRIDPEIRIYHDCNDGMTPCQREWKLGVPKSYINSKKVYDLGIVNLEMQLESESHDCIH